MIGIFCIQSFETTHFPSFICVFDSFWPTAKYVRFFLAKNCKYFEEFWSILVHKMQYINKYRQTISFIEISIEAGKLLGGKHEACFVLGVAGIEAMSGTG
jgi:hypothetical protein